MDLARRRRPRRRHDHASPRVLIIVQNLPVPLDRRVWMECQALVGAGYGVSVVCPMGPGDPAFEVLDGVRIHKYPPPAPAAGVRGYLYEFAYCWLQAARLAVKEYRRTGFDAIQACNPPDTYFALAALFRPFGVRFVFDHHDLCPEIYVARFGARGRLLLRALQSLERATFRVADHVISTNDSYRGIAIGRGGRRPETVTVVRSGPDLRRLTRVAPAPELKAGKPYLACYLGIMGPQDGVSTVLDAASVIVHEMGRTDCHFALLGFGDCLEELRRQAHRDGLDGFVTFTGRAGDEVLRRYLSTADIGLSPDPKSPFNDLSTMNKTVEYMAFGLPVVAFDLKETRVSAGAAASYVPDGDVAAYAKAVVRLLDAPERRAAMGAAGRRRVVEALAWEHQSPRYVAVYRDLLGRGRANDAFAESCPRVGPALTSTVDAEPMDQTKKRRLSDVQVAARLREAREGSQDAWDDLVDFFGGLIWSVARAHGLSGPDAADVAQVTWLRLVEHLDGVKEPERLAAWLATTTRRECIRILRSAQRSVPVPGDDAVFEAADRSARAVDAHLLAEEQDRAVVAAFRRLPSRYQVLLSLLNADPPIRYVEVAGILGMPIGSIGPTRQRALECLRHRLDEVAAGGRVPVGSGARR